MDWSLICTESLVPNGDEPEVIQGAWSDAELGQGWMLVAAGELDAVKPVEVEFCRGPLPGLWGWESAFEIDAS